MDETVDAVDRISELPTFIIHHIMSYLSPRDVARTSVLSKRWNQIRTTFPILDFGYPELIVPQGLNDQNLNVWKEKLLRNEKFDFFDELWFRTEILPSILFLDATLLKFRELNLAIQMMLGVEVFLMDVEGSSSLVDKWIRLAVENQVKKLQFKVDSSPAYTLPQTIYSAKSLTSLELAGCRLEEPMNAISLNSLKELSLRGVHINEQMFHRLIGECHLLEDLRLSGCSGLKLLSVSKDHKLKNLTIDELPWLREHCQLERVVVPSLQQLNFNTYQKKISVVAVCPNLKKLVLEWVMLPKDEEFYQLISKFPLLEDLSMTGCDTPERIKISSDRLKRLLFRGCDNLKAINVDTPNLLSFTFGITSVNSIPTVSSNTQCPWIVDFGDRTYRCGSIDTLWFLRLKEFLGASKQIKNLFIVIPICKFGRSEVEFNFEEVRKHSPCLPVQVRNMELEPKVPKAAGYEMLLDGLFWICYPKTLRLRATIGTSRLLCVNWLLKWLLKKPWNNRNFKCCKSSPIKCWKHDLKEIKMVSFLPWYMGSEPMKLDNVMDMLQEEDFTIPRGYYTLKLEWCVPVVHDTT